MPEIIFDSCVLSNFALSGSLYVIKKLYAGSCYINDCVSAEITRGIHAGHNNLQDVTTALREGWLKEIGFSGIEEQSLFETLSISLGSGEAHSMATAKARGFVFASDDRAARREARLLKIQLTGTIGILVKADRNKVINRLQADRILNRMIDSGFYSPIVSIEEIL